MSLLGSCDVVTNFGTTEHVGVRPSTFGDGGNMLDSKQWQVLCGIYVSSFTLFSLQDTCQWKMKIDMIQRVLL